MSNTLKGKTFYLHSVHPVPPSGPFPPTALASTHVAFAEEGGSVAFRAPINSGRGASYKVGQDSTSIVFSGACWTERGLARVPGDDEKGTLRRRCEEAENLLHEFSHGSFGLVVSNDGNSLVLKDAKSGQQLTFKTEQPHE